MNVLVHVSQITIKLTVCSSTGSRWQQRKLQLRITGLLWEDPRRDSPHKGPARRKAYLQTSSCSHGHLESGWSFVRKLSRPIILQKLTLQWRHNERDNVSSQWRLDGLLNDLFRRRSKKTSKLCVIGLCEGNSPVTGGFPSHKGPVTRKMFPFDDVIMWVNDVFITITTSYLNNGRVYFNFHPSLKRKCHFDKIFVTGCTVSGHNDKFRYSRWQKFRRNFFSQLWHSVLVTIVFYAFISLSTHAYEMSLA